MQKDRTIHVEGQGALLLRSVAEQLKVPLATIARQAELGQLTGQPALADLNAVRTHAAAALTLVDSYLLGLQLIQAQDQLPLEPVSLSSLLANTAHTLSALAKQYDIALRLHIGGRYEPVMAHAPGLTSALLSLAYGLLQGYPLSKGSELVLAVHRTPHGIVAGVYGAYEQLSAESWRKALALQGSAARPLSSLYGSGAALFVADAILQSMATRLRVGRYCSQQGLAATFQPSEQLTFV